MAQDILEFYVAPSGDEFNNGSRFAPFATLTQARDAVRKENRERPILVHLAPGTYPITETITFDDRDSGTEKAPVLYKAWGKPGTSRITGGQLITEWEPDGDGVYKAKIPYFVHAIYENGMPGIVSREPDVGEGEAPIGCNLLEAGIDESRVQFKEGQFEPFEADDVLIRIWPANWMFQQFPVNAIDFDSREIDIDGRLWQSGETRVGWDTRYFLQHARAFIDEPGEFYVDRETSTIYYKPRSVEELTRSVSIPALRTLVNIAGDSEDSRVSHLRFEGIAFSEVDSRFPGRRGAPAAAIRISNASDIQLKSILINNTGDNGIYMSENVDRVSITGSRVQDARHFGIRASSQRIKDFYEDLDDERIYGINDITIENCQITNIGRVGVHLVGVKGAYIRYCDISYCEKQAAVFLTCESSVVEHCRLHHLGNNYKDVAGGLYTNVMSRFIRFSNNRIHDIYNLDHPEGTPSKGIYLDYDGNFNIEVSNNVLYNIEPGVIAIKLGGEDILLQNNIIDNRGNDSTLGHTLVFWGGSHRLRWVSWLKDEIMYDRNMTFLNNIFLQEGTFQDNFIHFNTLEGWVDTVKVGVLTETLHQSNYNLYYNPDLSRSDYYLCTETVRDWQSEGYGENSLFGENPLFRDWENNDYRFRLNSPALDIGIKESDAASPEGVGLRQDFPFLGMP
ncbi:MAG: right-handed parallel beta-helix repeat-containing protein [Verrucomicrobiota bacterium]